jgi:hypothetical protein
MKLTSFVVALVVACTFLVVLFLHTREAFSQQAGGPSVVVVPLGYEHGKWFLNGTVKVLPCESPNRLQDESEADSLIEVWGGAAGPTVLDRYRIKNPRTDVGFDQAQEAGVGEEGRFFLLFALREGMKTLMFWEMPGQQGEPNVEVDLSQAIRDYYENGGPYQVAPCQLPSGAFRPDANRGN